jgi:hypothetical protein
LNKNFLNYLVIYLIYLYINKNNFIQYNNYNEKIKDKTSETERNEVINKAKFDLAVMIQRDLNFFNDKIKKEKDFSRVQIFTGNKNIVQSLLNSYKNENPSIQMQNVEKSALDSNYIILENFEITEKYIGVY